MQKIILFLNFFDKNQISKIFNNTKEFSFLVPWRGKFDESLFEEDLDNLELFYHNNGYRDFKILNKNIIYSENGIEINIDVYEGEKYYYSSINFIDNIKFTDNKLLEILNIKVGEQYNKEKLEFAIAENLSSLYMDVGHYYFNVISLHTWTFFSKKDDMVFSPINSLILIKLLLIQCRMIRPK